VHFFAYRRFYYFPNHHVVDVLFWHFPQSNYIVQAIASSKRSLWTILLSYSSSTSYRAARRYALRRSRRIYVRVRTDPQSAQLWMPVAYGAVGPGGGAARLGLGQLGHTDGRTDRSIA